MRRRVWSLPGALVLFVGGAWLTEASAQDVLAVKNARIYPVTTEVVPNGVLLIGNGKILGVGADLAIPEGARIVDAGGRSLIPGLVESHSHMGFKQLWMPTTGANNNELSSPINAQVRAIDGLNTHDAAFAIALAAGITTMNVTTGSRSPNSGQAVVIKLRGGEVEDMFLAHGGMKFAIRATERRPNFPETTEQVAELLRQELLAARAYLAAPPAARDLKLEALGKVLTREWPVGTHAHSESDMRHAIALKKEFGLDLFIHHANATAALADELLEAGIPVSFGPILPFMGYEEAALDGPIRMARRGGKVSFHQDHPDGHQYYLRTGAALFVRRGMPEEEALKALTLNPAALFRIDDRIGSLDKGKDADFVLLSGPPLDIESLVEQVFVEGREVFNRATRTNVFGSLP
jgi:imidazolonepropionase-like amidohydrolase